MIKKYFKMWFLKRELQEIEDDIDQFYLKLLCRNQEFQRNIDIEKLHRRFISLKNIEKREINRQINELKKN